ncbi:MAG TPA: PD-(D/E)XK nuclease family protein [Nanoarchaeota archaeon]|nr:PD-(D/E)XK nuclease family protein [Candidatus Pacearchaeota archaeon]HIH17988.1 PD-(D/E)XK nuclease family protein [Nanoarchaeota archaeon]HIH50975.1 PD-(D/E)XK nuclease family protein [Nanoarchaeota archaeon]
MGKELRSSLDDYIAWSPSRLKTWLACPRKYFHQYIAKDKAPITGAMARGILLHKRMTHMYRDDGTLKYQSSEKFANSAKGIWLRTIDGSVIEGQRIEWKDRDEPYQIMQDVLDVLEKVYETYSSREAPLLTEVGFDALLSGEGYFRIRGRIDEVSPIRETFKISDHKSGGENPKEQRLAYDLQFTLYALGLGSTIRDSSLLDLRDKFNPSFRKKAFFVIDELKDKPLEQITSGIELEYHRMRTGEMIPVPQRNEEHIKELFETLGDAEERISRATETGKWPVDRESCGECIFFKVCDRNTASVLYQKETAQPRQPSLFDDKAAVVYSDCKVQAPKEKHPKFQFPRAARRGVNS